jgi:hypothetical protein
LRRKQQCNGSKNTGDDTTASKSLDTAGNYQPQKTETKRNTKIPARNTGLSP